MSIPGDASPLLLGGGGPQQYKIERSLRFNSSDSAYLSRTPASAGNRKTWTYSLWVKKANIIDSGSRAGLLSIGPQQPGSFSLAFSNSASGNADGILIDRNSVSGPISSARFRDTSSWYHILFAVDTTLASGRIKVYVNGTQLTDWTGSLDAVWGQNVDTEVNTTSQHRIGQFYQNSEYFNGYLADIHLIDGQSLTPSSFAETNITTGQWVPKAYTGTYGTNGFRLAFADNSNNTATTLGKDSSPNGNNWTPNNLSVTAGAGNDSLVDTPTSYGTDTGAGGEVRGNYCTLNPLNKTSVSTLANGNLSFTSGLSFSFPAATGTVNIPTSGKWYWEYTLNNAASAYAYCGIVQPLNTSKYVLYYGINGTKDVDGTGSTYGASLANGDTVGVAVDVDNNAITFYKNNVSQGAIACVTSSGLYSAVFNTGTNSQNVGLDINFGQRPFAYTAPSGFKALCDTNLPAPVVAKPNSVFDVKLYSGNGSSQTISGLGFSPDLVWTKSRSNGGFFHRLQDTVRGATKELYSNSTNAEGTNANSLTAFNSDGFTLGSESGINGSGETFVAWNWDAGSSTVTNTQGSITSQVRANASAGFSIVTYTGNGTAGATIGHGLGIAPSFIVCKSRSNSSAWLVYHKSIGNTAYLLLNATDAAFSPSVEAWNNTTPSANVFTAGTGTSVNSNGSSQVAYCFAPVAGYSSFGSYTGNGSTDGPFVYTGFRPRWLILKATAAAGGNENWCIKDALRPAYNVTSGNLYANLSLGEDNVSTVDVDLLSNGFKLRGTYSGINTNAVTYIYAAFAENPFQYARAR